MSSAPERRRLLVQGAVQGVGFRPFVYRLAAELGICGWVNNSSQGVWIEAEAPSAQLDVFLAQLQAQKPPHSIIQSISVESIAPTGETGFEIRQSSSEGDRSAIILPDLATCPDCLSEILDPANRRYRYPFTNCTHCGARYSIIERLPYDRPNTSMHTFVMCDKCRVEYEDPMDRRFHAQPNACPTCGPQIQLWDQTGHSVAVKDAALLAAAEALRNGSIVALKGLGGFQLLVDARNDGAVRRLRERKHRPDKPLAVMVPSLEQAKEICELSEEESELLCSSAAPIVLLARLDGAGLCAAVAPGNPTVGVMLPYTPLHHLLMAELGFPVVATSGNLSGEPICIDEHEALLRLKDIADCFLVHDRPIVRPVDDSVSRIVDRKECMLRRARGYAPLPIELVETLPVMVAVGAHLKNTVAMSIGRQVFVSQHIGDLESPDAVSAFRRALTDLQSLYEQPPELIACDLHPDYLSTQLAGELAQQIQKPLVQVQHHYAHILACMAEHRLAAPVFGVAWDGTGYGTDGTIWGGEFLRIAPDSFEREAHLRLFRLPGGEQAIREPRRVALGLLFEMYGNDLPELPQLGFSHSELAIIKPALAHGVNAPLTSSMGRLFDGVSALLGLRQRATFEGQAAIELEYACHGLNTDRCYPIYVAPVTIDKSPDGSIIDWSPLVEGILADLAASVGVGEIAAAFHNSLLEMLVRLAERAQLERVVLGGGCFQNRRLLEGAIDHLRKGGFRPYWNQKIPSNDGGISLGQIAAAQRERQRRLRDVPSSSR